MIRSKAAVFSVLMLLITSAGAFADGDHVRIRTFFGMEPYGRMTVKNWSSPGQLEIWNVTYGFTPAIEILGVLRDGLELGAGARFQIPRRVLRSGGAGDETFRYIPVYAVGRFEIVDTDGIDMYGIVRLGYSFLLSSRAFRDIWQDEATGESLESTGGGFYAGGSLGVEIALVDRRDWGMDWSMDAGYSFHGGSGVNASGKNFAVNYQAFSADFSLDWRF